MFEHLRRFSNKFVRVAREGETFHLIILYKFRSMHRVANRDEFYFFFSTRKDYGFFLLNLVQRTLLMDGLYYHNDNKMSIIIERRLFGRGNFWNK